MIRSFVMLVMVLGLVVGGPTVAGEALKISLAHDSVKERATKQQLERLLNKYDLSRWIYTKEIVVDEDDTPHSEPVLMLHTRHLHDDDLLLSTFVHEQMHRFLAVGPPTDVGHAEADLRKLFPAIPVGYPEGSTDDDVNYEHLLVIWWEYDADIDLLGELRAHEVMQFWASDHYTWIYRKMLDRQVRADIFKVIKTYNLIPGA
jgi:hypothetical protein